jgi:hypothetical protein
MDNVLEWLMSLDDLEFDRLWVGAVISGLVEDDLSVRDLSGILVHVRDRMRRMAHNGTFNEDSAKIYNMTVGRARLNPTQVRIIRRVRGVPNRELGAVFGVGCSTISRVKTGFSWYGSFVKPVTPS